MRGSVWMLGLGVLAASLGYGLESQACRCRPAPNHEDAVAGYALAAKVEVLDVKSVEAGEEVRVRVLEAFKHATVGAELSFVRRVRRVPGCNTPGFRVGQQVWLYLAGSEGNWNIDLCNPSHT